MRALSQFLLVDDAPDPAFSVRTNPRLAWRTFQTGLKLLNGKKKPAYRAYATPLYIKTPRVRRGRAVRLFGMLRAANATTRPLVTIQLRAQGRQALHHAQAAAGRRAAPLLQHDASASGRAATCACAGPRARRSTSAARRG